MTDSDADEETITVLDGESGMLGRGLLRCVHPQVRMPVAIVIELVACSKFSTAAKTSPPTSGIHAVLYPSDSTSATASAAGPGSPYRRDAAQTPVPVIGSMWPVCRRQVGEASSEWRRSLSNSASDQL